MATYKTSNYQGVRIECWTPSDYSFLPAFYILMKKQALSPTHLNAVRRMFANRPNYQVMDTIVFHTLFED